ncbi:hypothetical protein [Leisingera sp. F5]|uniref:hypothetical protein n=1 Tax=Leisingera sp. F5 TaxID=1813816 RepID=UPI000B25A6C4|nr:hypothetical protein [Leisingera sp. F5]
MQVRNTIPVYTAPPEDFRAWVQGSLAALKGVSATSLALKCGLGKNVLRTFLNTPDRDIAMSSAHAITCKLREMAADQQVQLPRVEVRAHG